MEFTTTNKWRRWFAWRPVCYREERYTKDGGTTSEPVPFGTVATRYYIWLRVVERRKKGPFGMWEYRLR